MFQEVRHNSLCSHTWSREVQLQRGPGFNFQCQMKYRRLGAHVLQGYTAPPRVSGEITAKSKYLVRVCVCGVES